MIPDYARAQELAEGYEKASHLLLTAGVALVAGGRKTWAKTCGAAALGAYVLVQRRREAHLKRLRLSFPVMLPVATQLALRGLPHADHRGIGNLQIQTALEELAAACSNSKAPVNLLLDQPQADEPEAHARIRRAHHNLDASLADHFNFPSKAGE